MGTWGVKTFENDSACDWIHELEESLGSEFLETSLSTELDDYGDLDAYDGTRVLCAAEVICALLGKPSADLPEEVIKWVEENRNVDLSSLQIICSTQVSLVLADNSELKDLWLETEENYSSWKANVDSLLNRLG